MFIMWLAIGLIVGIALGGICTTTYRSRNYIGELRVDDSDPDGTLLFLELNEGVDTVRRQKYVSLKVKNENFISQK